MEQILYLMHVDWNWIKQRPQFIAEELSNYYKVNIIYKYSYNKKGLQNNNPSSNITLLPVKSVPHKFMHLPFAKNINKVFFKKKVLNELKQKNIKKIYITSPLLYDYLPKNYNGEIIYDCMDDHVALESNTDSSLIQTNEKKLIDKATKVLVSSINLKIVLIGRYGKTFSSKLELVRNGYNGEILSQKSMYNLQKNKKKIISYFGTVSSWFNFKLIQESLKDFADIEYHIYGPVETGIQVPKDKRIKLMGTVEHDKLYSAVKDSIALIMPFKVNKIIESVDPVKLYEYINFNKNILTVKYEEINRFDKFVYFYRDYSEYKKQLEKLLQSNEIKYSNEERIAFLKQNSWNNRAKQIVDILND